LTTAADIDASLANGRHRYPEDIFGHLTQGESSSQVHYGLAVLFAVALFVFFSVHDTK
jgi:hypothetical protein